MRSMLSILTLCMAFMMLPGQAMATPGGVDSKGCHNSQKIGFHCHPERAPGSGGADGSKKDREARLKKECKGAVNAGACTGYTGKT